MDETVHDIRVVRFGLDGLREIMAREGQLLSDTEFIEKVIGTLSNYHRRLVNVEETIDRLRAQTN